jgi:predicted PurR-regulated permease PerM
MAVHQNECMALRNIVPEGDEKPRKNPEPAIPEQPEMDRPALPTMPASNWAQQVIALGVVIAGLKLGKILFITLLVAVLLAFILDPLVHWMERVRIPRPLGALLALALVGAGLWFASYTLWVKAQAFAHELPKYRQQIQEEIGKYTRKAQQIQQSTQNIAGQQEDKNTMRVREVGNSGAGGVVSSVASLTETLLILGFIPFLSYFMLTWEQHIWSATVKLFPLDRRTVAYVTLGRMSEMLRSFIVGNLFIGLFMGGLCTVAFWAVHVPYFYFLGFISGFLSLVPYLGVLFAIAPPLIASVGHINHVSVIVIVGVVLSSHLFSMNVLYPKVLGRRLELNPLVVTIGLLFWGYLWGAMGLILAVPITGAIKIICDHIEGLRGLGDLMGEGKQAVAV